MVLCHFSSKKCEEESTLLHANWKSSLSLQFCWPKIIQYNSNTKRWATGGTWPLQQSSQFHCFHLDEILLFPSVKNVYSAS